MSTPQLEIKQSTLAEIWVRFEQTVLDPIGAGDVQRQEVRRAFYSGAAALLELVLDIGEPGFEEDAGVNRLAKLEAEIAQFSDDLAQGRA